MIPDLWHGTLREPFGWVAWGVLGLGALLMAWALALACLCAARRGRLSLKYSPVTMRRALLSALGALLLVALGGGLVWFAGALALYDPARPGEPVGLVYVREGRVVFQSAFDGREEDLGSYPGGPFAVVGDALVLPSWTRYLGAGSYHRARGLWRPLAPGRPGPPAGEPLFPLVSSPLFPGRAITHVSPAIRSPDRRVALHLVPDGGYVVHPYPGTR